MLAALIVIATIGLTMVQAVLVINYRRFLLAAPKREAPDLISDSVSPLAAIVLCLRGDDPGLIECLTGIVGQDYREFELHIAFDSRDDPATQTVRDFFAERQTPVRLHFFEPKPDCSYKCSAITHVVERLSKDIEIVAFCDADAIVDQNWLNDLVAGLDDPLVGATTGNRWFRPMQPQLGSLLRKYWNSGAVVQMQAYDIAWGGSLAMRREVIEDCGLLKHWSQAFCEDTMMSRALARHGYRLERLPHVIVENQESADVSGTFSWIVRQLLTVRLHHPDWVLIVGHGVLSAVANWVAPVVALLSLMFGYFPHARALMIAFLIYQIFNLVLLRVIEIHNRRIIVERQSFNEVDAASFGSASPLEHLKSILLTQFLYPWAVYKAYTATETEWRGVDYLVTGKKVQVKEMAEASADSNSIEPVQSVQASSDAVF